MATAKKTGKSRSAKAGAKAGARRPAKAAARPKGAAKAKGAKTDVVYSDLRRDALAWQLSRLR
jgi:hypothetical protein